MNNEINESVFEVINQKDCGFCKTVFIDSNVKPAPPIPIDIERLYQANLVIVFDKDNVPNGYVSLV
ncbi:hypothetical protein SY212_19630 [Ligilactobacillus agilis]|uniref:Uncharacterized protein n=1 Tax=Ligilactobacillus agilis TaxID=1601 RepID=A0A6F9XNS8_9LACO|nr:hypothetical protein [Ligilactobacillus agilis]MDM8279195.1 hypothetical protein [Ligilactobacillus agilis]GET06933.1 hypothetical protein SY212_19630 [Ligilactobacillus agilis]